MLKIAELMNGIKSVAIVGHIRPDGDSIGACIGLYQYIIQNYPEIETKIYLEKIANPYKILKGAETICSDFSERKQYDLLFCLDCADEERLGEAVCYKNSAKRTVCIDHHISNTGSFAEVNYIDADASSTCELVYRTLDETKVTREVAAALYLGMVHDTGVFRYSCTSPETMEVAAALMRTGINSTEIINHTFYDKTYHQNQILGRALLESIRLLDGKIIFSAVKLKEMEFYGVEPCDLDGIVQTLINTTGTEAAIFIYETAPQQYKVSMRSKSVIDVSEIAGFFGGGGHVRAAGCNMQGSVFDVVNNITLHMEEQLKREKNCD